MAGMNKVILIGNLGKDPEMTTSNSGMAITKFSIATSDGVKDQNGDVPTEWHRCVSFGKTAETIGNFVKKGSSICIEGSIKYGSYENKDGATVYTTDIIVQRFTFLDKKESGGNNQQQRQQQSAPQQFNANQQMDQSELPF